MRLSTKIVAAFLLIIIAYLVSFIVNLKLSAEVNRNTEFLTNSEAVIRNSVRIHKGMIDMQSGFRGYLLTTNENFLAPYYEGLKTLRFLLEEERKLILNSPSQLEKLDSIQVLHEEWIDYSSTLINAKQKELDPEIIDDQYSILFKNKLQKEVGKKLNDKISEKFREFDRYEYELRQIRRDRLYESIEYTRKVSTILALVTISIGLISAVYITHVITKRISTMVGLADRISRGNFEQIEDTGNDELTHLSQSLNRMSNKLDISFTELARKNKELDQFAYVVSHDLKAPLRGMYNVFNWIEEDHRHELSGQLDRYLKMMKGRIHRLESLISGLLEYARIGRVSKPTEKVNIQELLEEVVEMIVPPGFKVIIDNQLKREMETDKLSLQQVFTNLISNAVKYNGKENGKIMILCRERHDLYEFSVSDDGVGIAEEYHGKIFKIFQTLREKNESESTGVGLAIVKKILEEKNGTISVSSEEGVGSTFVFTWPKIMKPSPVIN